MRSRIARRWHELLDRPELNFFRDELIDGPCTAVGGIVLHDLIIAAQDRANPEATA
jgi:hypothetical protein